MTLSLYTGEECSREALDLIPLPQETETYRPLSHFQLANKMMSVSQDMLHDYVLVGERYGIARKGNQLFAVLSFQGESREMGLSIAFRNSYDKSMSFGIACGAQVFVCENLALQGDIVVMKKHTKTIWDTLEETVLGAIYRAQKSYEKVLIDSDRLKQRELVNRDAFQLMGLLYGMDIVSPRQLTILKQQWLTPRFPEFAARSAWSFFNATTHALKSSPPTDIMERHSQAYNMILDV